jgi:hypothetical protein
VTQPLEECKRSSARDWQCAFKSWHDRSRIEHELKVEDRVRGERVGHRDAPSLGVCLRLESASMLALKLFHRVSDPQGSKPLQQSLTVDDLGVVLPSAPANRGTVVHA